MLFSKLLNGALTTLAVGGALVFHQGVIYVDVQEKHANGNHVRVFVPATVVPLATTLAPASAFERLPAEARSALPAIRVAAEELEKCPDTVFVEVQDGREHVKIEKQGSSLVIDVDSPSEKVYVRIPLSIISELMRDIESSQARK